jgi:hypothetical protein
MPMSVIRGFGSTNVAVMINGAGKWHGRRQRFNWSNWAGLSDVTRTMAGTAGNGHRKLPYPRGWYH